MYEKHPNQTPSAETKQTDRKKKKKSTGLQYSQFHNKENFCFIFEDFQQSHNIWML